MIYTDQNGQKLDVRLTEPYGEAQHSGAFILHPGGAKEVIFHGSLYPYEELEEIAAKRGWKYSPQSK